MELEKVSPLSQCFPVVMTGLNEEVRAPQAGSADLSSSCPPPPLSIPIPALRPSSIFTMYIFPKYS